MLLDSYIQRRIVDSWGSVMDSSVQPLLDMGRARIVFPLNRARIKALQETLKKQRALLSNTALLQRYVCAEDSVSSISESTLGVCLLVEAFQLVKAVAWHRQLHP
jgi:hypothetical protein